MKRSALPKNCVIYARVPEVLHAQLSALASERGETINAVVVEALSNVLNGEKVNLLREQIRNVLSLPFGSAEEKLAYLKTLMEMERVEK